MVAQGGFYEPRKTNKTGIALVIAGHAAAIVAVLLAKGPHVVPFIPTVTIADSIKDTVPPEPDKLPPPKPVARQDQVDLVKSVVPPLAVDPGPIFVRNIEPPTISDGVGSEPVKPVPDPVFVTATMEPGAANRFQPDYPPALLRADIEGWATVRILIGADGRVQQVEKVSATEPAFFDATERQALRYWRFKAATRDGVRVESWRTLTVRFKVER
jgi:protein TonB